MTFETDNKMTFEPDKNFESGVVIRVIGVGGGGNNAISRMIKANIRGVDFIAVNTDRQALRRCEAPTQMVIGEKITNGHGAGADPEKGERAAEESIDEIKSAISGADMVFVTAGMGGGTGTGAAPVVARVAQEMGILTVGIVTTPFSFELKRRMEQAERGIKELRQHVDSLVVIPNSKLEECKGFTLGNAFELADDTLCRGVQCISELINVAGFINLDFADVTAVMKDGGYAHMGMGKADGADKANEAAAAAISSPVLGTTIKGARGVLINITASSDVSLEDVRIASERIASQAHPDANVIWGLVFDESMKDEMRITIIATGFEDNNEAETVAAPVVTEPVVQKIVTPAPAVSVAPVAPVVPAAPVAPTAPAATAPVTEAVTADETTPAVIAQAPAAAPVVTEAAPAAPVEQAADGDMLFGDEFDALISNLKHRSRPDKN